MQNTLTPAQEAELKAKWLDEELAKNELIQVPYPKKAGIVPYLVSVVAVILIAVAGVVTLESISPPEKDNSVLTLGIIGIVTLVIPLIFQLIKSQELVAKQDATHFMMNSHLVALLKAREAASFSAGTEAGEKKANDRTDVLRESIPVNSVQMVTRVRTGTTQPLTLPEHKPPADKQE